MIQNNILIDIFIYSNIILDIDHTTVYGSFDSHITLKVC